MFKKVIQAKEGDRAVMQTHAKVIKVNGFICEVQFHDKVPKEDEYLTVKWGKSRSTSQNSLYWKLLEWLIDEGGMKDQGYMFKEELHEALKNRLLSNYCEKGFKSVIIRSTTELTADEFMEYIDKCEHILKEYCGVDMTPFWREYGDLVGE